MAAIPKKPDGMSDTEYLELLSSEVEKQQSKSDKMHLKRSLAFELAKYLDKLTPGVDNFVKTDIFAHALYQYEQEQSYSDKGKMLTGNSKEELLDWLSDQTRIASILDREYIDKMTSDQIALEVYQLKQSQAQLAGQDIRMSQIIFWQTSKSIPEATTIEASFFDFLTIHEEYADIARKLLQLPQEYSDTTWTCRLVMQFGIKYYPELAESFDDKAKLKLLADWLKTCPAMHRIVYDFHEKLNPDPAFVKDEFLEFYGLSELESASPYTQKHIADIAISMRMLDKYAQNQTQKGEDET